MVQYLRGQNLSTTFLSGDYHAFDMSQIVNVALQLAGGRSYVHERGFLHLDVKPSSVIYGNRHMTLFDFSVA